MQAGPNLEHTFEIENTSDEPVWIEVCRAYMGGGTRPREVYCIEGNATHNLTVSVRTAVHHGPCSWTTLVKQVPPSP